MFGLRKEIHGILQKRQTKPYNTESKEIGFNIFVIFMTRRTRPGFLSAGEAELDSLRTRQMVRGITGTNELQTQNNTDEASNKNFEHKKQSNQITID